MKTLMQIATVLWVFSIPMTYLILRGPPYKEIMWITQVSITAQSLFYPTGCYAVIMLVLVVFHLTGEKQPEQSQPTTTRPASLVVSVEPEPPPIVVPPMPPIKLFDHLEEHR